MSLFLGGLPWTAFSKFQSPNPTPTFSIILFWFFFYSFTAYKYYWLSSAQTLEWIPWSEKILTVFFSAVSTLLLLSHLSCVRLCATPETAAHQAPPSLGFSRQEHWSGLSFPSPVHESEKWKWSRSVVSDSSDPMDCSPPGSSVHVSTLAPTTISGTQNSKKYMWMNCLLNQSISPFWKRKINWS